MRAKALTDGSAVGAITLTGAVRPLTRAADTFNQGPFLEERLQAVEYVAHFTWGLGLMFW
jgi:hypothetical protein